MKTKKQDKKQAPATAKKTDKVKPLEKTPVTGKPVVPDRPAGRERKPAAEKSAVVGKAVAAKKQVSPDKPTALEQPMQPRKAIAPEKTGMDTLGFKKEYLNPHPGCKITFMLPSEAAPEAKKVTIVGDFNNWNREANPMKMTISGDFTVTLELETGKEYRFRYLIDGKRWENDWRADKYVKSPYGVYDSVVCV